MATITVYAFENEDGQEDTFTTTDPNEAKERGQRYSMRVIGHEYEWSDSETAWDFTGEDPDPNGEPRECGCGGRHNVHRDD
jgi:hypothetical protein